MEENFGVMPCTAMSMLSNALSPSACETDVTGLVGMYAMILASGKPSALVDWNNNYGDDPNKCVFFHCSNLPRSMFRCARMGVQDIIGGTVGIDNTWGTCTGRLAPGPFSFLRVSTDDVNGLIVGYVGEGEMADDTLETFGGFGVAHIEKLQKLLRFICRYGLEHHVAITSGQVAKAVHEALIRYLGWSIMHHNASEE
jgi:L-fucose isomerase-like protein